MDHLCQIKRLLAPKAFGEGVIGSTPVFSTKTSSGIPESVFILRLIRNPVHPIIQSCGGSTGNINGNPGYPTGHI